jgi:hypothetical protein
MSEQIKNLMAQAGTDTSGKWMSIDNSKVFAKLIIEEACTVLEGWKGEPFPFDEDLAVSLIKEHFGDLYGKSN